MIRLKRAFVICMAVMLGTICAAGCASDEKKEDSKLPGYVVYTANSSGTGLDSERYEIIETEADDVINRLYKLVSRSTDRGVSGIYAQLSRRPDFTVSSRVLYVDLPESYNNMNNVDRILLRASIVKTMIQLEEIDYVTFNIDNKPLTMYAGIGNDINTAAGYTLLNENNFVDSELNAYDMLERREMVLYYADADGTGLVGERGYVSYNKNMPIEQVMKLVSSLQLDSESINTWKNGVERALKKYVTDGTEAKGKKCPNCGNETLVYQEGCLICKTCGASRCG